MEEEELREHQSPSPLADKVSQDAWPSLFATLLLAWRYQQCLFASGAPRVIQLIPPLEDTRMRGEADRLTEKGEIASWDSSLTFPGIGSAVLRSSLLLLWIHQTMMSFQLMDQLRSCRSPQAFVTLLVVSLGRSKSHFRKAQTVALHLLSHAPRCFRDVVVCHICPLGYWILRTCLSTREGTQRPTL